ncbi:MAG: hypothetical protein AAF570_29125 [Bacteroidota bacterium]
MTPQPLTAGKNAITFRSFGVDFAGDLYLPEAVEASTDAVAEFFSKCTDEAGLCSGPALFQKTE